MGTNLKTKREQGKTVATKRAEFQPEPKPLDVSELANQAGTYSKDFHSIVWVLANATSIRENIEHYAAKVIQQQLQLLRAYRNGEEVSEAMFEYVVEKALKSIEELTK